MIMIMIILFLKSSCTKELYYIALRNGSVELAHSLSHHRSKRNKENRGIVSQAENSAPKGRSAAITLAKVIKVRPVILPTPRLLSVP
jgi:hypothetical protein